MDAKDAPVKNMPLPLRAWATTRRLPAFRGRNGVAARIAARSLDPNLTYRTPQGIAMRVDPTDFFQIAMLMGFYEPRVQELVERMVQPGSVAIDVGHAIGYFSLMIATRTGPGGEVHAFDPDPRAHQRLLEHASCNEMPWIHVNRLALGDHEGTVNLGIHDRIGWSSTKEVKEFAGSESVSMKPLDVYLSERGVDPSRISLIKIDAEGGELEVLRGMTGTLATADPTVCVEVIPHRPGERAAEVLDYMNGIGYTPDAESGDVVFTKSG